MKTYIIIKESSTRYHIYNGDGECVAIVYSRWEVFKYLDEVFRPSSCTSYTFKPSAVAGTFIVTMKLFKSRCPAAAYGTILFSLFAAAQQRPTEQLFIN